jgi:hypothetical protein
MDSPDKVAKGILQVEGSGSTLNFTGRSVAFRKHVADLESELATAALIIPSAAEPYSTPQCGR